MRTVSPMNWTPTKKNATLSFWWRMDSVTTSGSLVTAITDKSGNSQSPSFGATRQGTLSVTQLNGRPGVSGNAAKTVMGTVSSPTALFNLTAPFAVVLAFNCTVDASAGFTQFFRVNSTTASADFNIFTVSGGGIAGYQQMNFGRAGAGANTTVGIATYNPSSPHWLAIDYNGSGVTTAGNWRAWKSGASQTIVASSTAGATNATVLGEGSTGGGHSFDASSYWYDAFVYTGANAQFTTNDLVGIGNYMNYVYGL